MKIDRSARMPDSPSISSWRGGWTHFWFTPIPTTGLHCLRVLSGVLFFTWLASFAGHQEAFFSLQGWFDREAHDAVVRGQQLQQNIAPAPIGWSMLYLAERNIQLFQAMYWGSLVVLALFTLGVATRVTGILTWVIVVSFLANPATSYEGDYLLGILAFYLMIGHVLVGQWNGNPSIAGRILGSWDDFLLGHLFAPASAKPRPASYGANWTIRLLQIHVMIIIVTSGLHKLQMGDWWAGVALWYPLHPPFHTTPESLMLEKANIGTTLFFLSLLQYLALAWQISFPLFAWRKGIWRGVLLGGAIAYWLGVVFVFKLPLFGPFVFLGCLSFLEPDEWAWVGQRVRSIVLGGPTSSSTAPFQQKVAVTAIKEKL